MTAPTPPPATGRDTGEAVESIPDLLGHLIKAVARAKEDRTPRYDRDGGNLNPTTLPDGYDPEVDPPPDTQPPAPQAGAPVEALADVIGHHLACSCPELLDVSWAEHIAFAVIASDLLAQRDATVRAEVGERIASAIETLRESYAATALPPSVYMSVLEVLSDAARIARTTGGDR